MSSWLKIDLLKRVLVRMGFTDETIKRLASSIRCRVGRLPIQYLGLPIGANVRSKAVVYFMCLFKRPKEVIRINHIMRSFFFGAGQNDNKKLQ